MGSSNPSKTILLIDMKIGESTQPNLFYKSNFFIFSKKAFYILYGPYFDSYSYILKSSCKAFLTILDVFPVEICMLNWSDG